LAARFSFKLCCAVFFEPFVPPLSLFAMETSLSKRPTTHAAL
jgi:hypothetical protein